MSTSFVIPGVSWPKILEISKECCAIRKEKDCWRLYIESDQKRGLAKRIELSHAAGRPPDDLPPGHEVSTVYLYETKDVDNSWFEGFTTSLSHPEVVLDTIIAQLKTYGVYTEYLSEHDKGYGAYLDDDEISEDDLPIGY